VTTINLGYEVGSGKPIAIPLKHVVVTGQTQESGKTTTLEAMVARSGVKAVAFIAKRGEGSFSDARTIPPYFREQADWQFVASILEASRGEKLKFERAWIIRASKGARTLADVQRNVRKALETAKGLSADVYLTLDAYLEAVVPQIDRIKWATSVKLSPGINVMDLTKLNVEMQHLVIRSTIDWVLNNETHTVVVVPEAWKFIPQGRGTPVKLAAESFIRQSAGLKNYLWLDSQDIAGVEKIILKSVPLWIVGVQRESNEVKRTLAQIPSGIKKPKADDIATLGIGEFYVCHGKCTSKVYVQPKWMDETTAHRIATGKQADIPAAPKTKVQPKVEDDMPSAKEIAAELAKLMQPQQMAPAPQPIAPAKPVRRTEPAPQPVSDPDFDESFYQKIKARLLTELPMNGHGPIIVTPPEKLRKDFQQEETARIIAAARELRSLPKKVLKLIETTDEFVSQPTIAMRLGRSRGGGAMADTAKACSELAALGFAEIKKGAGVHKALRSKIAADLAFYQPTDGEIEEVYQNVLYLVATEGGD
jgi:hypothetical protein